MASRTKRRRAPGNDLEDDSDRAPRRAGRRNGSDNDDSGRENHQSDMEVDGQNSNDGVMAKRFVRYALACEASRSIIRREGIKENALGGNGRVFKRIFNLTQIQLRKVFGMELRELPAKEKLTLQEKRQAMKSNSQPKTGSGTYILVSTLPKRYRESGAIPATRTPDTAGEAAYTGFYTLIISIISLSGGELSDQKLRRHLNRVNADQNLMGDKTDLVLTRMQRQGYIVRKVERLPGGSAEEEQISWLVGPRGKVEVGAERVAAFIRNMYGGSTTELEKKIAISLNIAEQPVSGRTENDNSADMDMDENEDEDDRGQPGPSRGQAANRARRRRGGESD